MLCHLRIFRFEFGLLVDRFLLYNIWIWYHLLSNGFFAPFSSIIEKHIELWPTSIVACIIPLPSPLLFHTHNHLSSPPTSPHTAPFFWVVQKKKAIQTTSKLTRFCCCVSAAYRSHLTGKSFPNTSSEVDLQKYNASALWDHSTSLGNLAADSLKYKVRA